MAAADVKLSPEHSPSSSASSPESIHGDVPATSTSREGENNGVVVVKRKGGRKPVYATQEERKMRNRAAQAAFRERRTEYIKHLEATIKHHEDALATLQQASRNATDELLMLRYKNSLLERILMEKQIDVHTELKAFSQGDAANVGAVPSLPLHPPHVQRALNQRQAMQRTFHNQGLHQTQPRPSDDGTTASSSQVQSQTQSKGARRATTSEGTRDPANPKTQIQQQQPAAAAQSIQPPVSKRLRRTSETGFASKEGTSILPSPSTRGSSPMVVSPSVASLSSASGTQPFIPPTRVGGEQPAVSTFYPSPYQALMDKLDQEYDGDAFEGENGPDPMDTSPTNTQRPEFVAAHRRHQSASAVSSAATTGSSIPAVIAQAHKGGPPPPTGADGSPGTFFNAGSWTVDLFSDPYIVSNYGNGGNPFQAFPTSSMR